MCYMASSCVSVTVRHYSLYLRALFVLRLEALDRCSVELPASSLMQTDGVRSTGYPSNEMSMVDPAIFGNENLLSNT